MTYADRIKAAAHAALKGYKQVRNRELIHPHRDWGFGVLAATLLFVVVSVWSVQLYLEYRTRSLEVPTTNTTRAVVYRESRVVAALAYLDEQGERLAALGEGVVSETVSVPPAVPVAEPATTTLVTPTSTPDTVTGTSSAESEASVSPTVPLPVDEPFELATSTPVAQPFLQ